MVSTSGAKLLEPAAVKILTEKLLPLAALVTPNLDEAEILTGHRPASVEEMREAARQIHSRFGCAALVKGGHLKSSREAVDIFFDGKTELLLSAPFVKGIRTHGTGCTYSAAICAALALGHDLPRALENLLSRRPFQAVTKSEDTLRWESLTGRDSRCPKMIQGRRHAVPPNNQGRSSRKNCAAFVAFSRTTF